MKTAVKRNKEKIVTFRLDYETYCMALKLAHKQGSDVSKLLQRLVERAVK